MGDKCRSFQQKFSAWIGNKYSIYVNSGSSANLMLLHACKILFDLKQGDAVLCSSLTWSTNVAPIIQLGLKPIFYDISADNFNVYHSNLLKLNQEFNIKLIFVTHALGVPHRLDLFKDIFCNVPIIQDCCEAQGSILNDKYVGTTEVASTFSLYFGHHMTSIEGGIITTNNFQLYKLLLLSRNHGLYRSLAQLNIEPVIEQQYQNIDKRFLFLIDGFNMRNTEINAVVGIEQLKKINRIIAKRNSNHLYFLNQLKRFNIKLKTIDQQYFSDSMMISSFCFPLVCESKEQKLNLLIKLKQYQIETRPVIAGNITKQPMMENHLDPRNCELLTEIQKLHNYGFYVGNSHLLSQNRIKGFVEVMSHNV